ncbi:TetR family transcriptional regulator [Pseudarthrobacter sp. S3]|uniref:TetR family transcriptional regulator n=1 Tax=Pseudarthrobacter sp. S3 TaxID=3418419 RepID=UPI003CF6026C
MRLPARERKEQLIAATIELMRREGVQPVTMRAIAKEANAPLAMANYCFSNKENLLDAEIELILWATRHADVSPLATKIYPACEVELGNIFSSAAQSSGERCLIFAVRAFLMIYDVAATQYLTGPKAADSRALFRGGQLEALWSWPTKERPAREEPSGTCFRTCSSHGV